MKTKNWFFIWGLLAMMLTFAACSDDNDGGNGDGKSELVGVWESRPGEDGGVIEFHEDGTYVWDEYEIGEYTYKNGTLRLKYDGEVEVFDVTLKGKTLTLTYADYPDESFTFHKTSGGDIDENDGNSSISALVGTWIGDDEDGTRFVFRKDGTCNVDGDEAEYTYNARTGELVIDYGDNYPDVFNVISVSSTRIFLEDEFGDVWTLRKK